MIRQFKAKTGEATATNATRRQRNISPAPGRLSRTLTLWDGSAAQPAARLVPGVAIVAAFHSLSAEALAKLDHSLDCDTLICGDSAEAKAAVIQLAGMIPGVRAIDAGPLENAGSGRSAGDPALALAANSLLSLRAIAGGGDTNDVQICRSLRRHAHLLVGFLCRNPPEVGR